MQQPGLSSAVVAMLTTIAVSALFPTSSRAQTASSGSDSEVSEVVVSARRVSERLLDVPASVSVLTSADLASSGAQNTADVIRLTPGVTIVTGTAEQGDTQISIRGINGARDAESNVALVVDGILKTDTAALNQYQGRLEQFEIVKGPQGAYYGRDAEAGAIVITTEKPGTTFKADTSATLANNSTYSARLTASGPLSDSVGLLMGADYRYTDGFFRNTGPDPAAAGATVDQYKGGNVYARLVYAPGEGTDLDVKARYGYVRSGSIDYNVAFNLPNFAALDPAFNENANHHNFVFQSNIPSDDIQRTYELSAKLEHAFERTKLIAWVAHSRIDQQLAADDGTAAFGFFNNDPICRGSVAAAHAAGVKLPPPLILGSVPTSNLFAPNGSLLGAFSPTTCDGTEYQIHNQRDTSVEVRWLSTGDARLRWALGAYYLHINRQVGVNVGWDKGQGILHHIYNGRDSANPTEELSYDDFVTNDYAGFGSVDYGLSARWKLSAALRYDSEHRDDTNLVDPNARNQWILGGNQPLNVGLLFGALRPESAVFNQAQPKISVAFQPSKDSTYYASWGIGFKSGGFNNQGSAAAIDLFFNQPLGSGLRISDRYTKETASTFELGLKGRALDGRLSFEAAAYYNQIRNMQFFEFYAGPFGILRVVSNIDRVRIAGAEAAATLRVLDHWSLLAGVDVNNSRIQENAARPGTVGGEAPYAAQYTVNGGINLDLPVSSRTNLIGRLNYRRAGPTWFSTAQRGNYPTVFNEILPLAGLPAFLGTGNYSNSRRAAFDTVDLRLGVEYSTLRVVGFAANLFNTKYLAEVIPAPEFGGSFVSPGDRRTYGVEVSYLFE